MYVEIATIVAVLACVLASILSIVYYYLGRQKKAVMKEPNLSLGGFKWKTSGLWAYTEYRNFRYTFELHEGPKVHSRVYRIKRNGHLILVRSFVGADPYIAQQCVFRCLLDDMHTRRTK